MVTAIRAERTGVSSDRRFSDNGAARNALWMTRLRWFAGSAIIVGAIAGALLGIIREAGPILVVGVVVLGYNVILSYALGAGKMQRLGRLGVPGLVQIIADIAAVTAIIYFWGGVENPIVVFYLLPMACAGTILPSPLNYLMATLATALFGTVAVLQAAVPALYHPMASGFSGHYFDRWSFVGFDVVALAAVLHASVYLTAAASGRMRDREEQILRNRNLLDSVISCMPDGLVCLAPDGTVLLRNPTVAEWFPNDPVGQDSAAAEEHELPEGLRQYIGRVKGASSPLPAQSFRVEVTVGADKRVRKFRAAAAGVFDKQGKHLGYVIVADDVTEQLKLEEDRCAHEREAVAMSEVLEKNPREIAQREKMVAIGTMAAGIGHEIGNPLASLSAVVQLLKRRHHSDEDHHHLHTLQEQIDRIAKIVRQMLEFSRPAASEWVLADPNELIDQTVRMVSFSHRARHVRIESVCNSQLPKVRVMPQLFQQVLVNLLLNAVDAVEGVEGEKLVTVERVLENGWVNIMVKDRGVGMSEDQVSQVFEPFYTTKPPGKGVGLGMAVSYRLVQRQGGRIGIDSAPGKGTVVTVMFRGEQPTARTGEPAACGQAGTPHSLG